MSSSPKQEMATKADSASRRKSSAGDRAPPPPPEPATLAAARAVVGARVEKVFMDEAAGAYRPYAGEVVDVMGSVHRPDKGVDKRFHFLVRYEDGDEEHMLWPELCKVMLPEGGGAEAAAAAAAAATAAAPPAGPKKTASSGKRQADARGRDTVKEEADGEAGAAAAKPDPSAARKRRASGARKPVGAAAAADDEAGGDDDGGDEQPAGAAAVAPSPLMVSSKRARKSAAAAADDDDVRLPDSNPADGNNNNADGNKPAAAAMPALSDAATLSAGPGGIGAEAGGDADADGALAGIDSRLRARGLPGHLRRVRLRNFMCHANFEMEFGPHVNVVSGTNGSGKSAVLQAIQACLGASAKVTGRATSLGDFVRTGAPEALVSVELWNAGEDGYDRARLGDCVTIERRIAAGTGASSWRVLNGRGQQVATGPAAKKRLIDPLLDHLSVNASNPMAAMTQDTARTFLSSGATGPQRRFELFMEATMLALFKTNLDAARSYAAQMASRVQEVQREHFARVAKFREAERKLRLLDEAKQLAADRSALERAAAWALAAEGQAEVRALRERVEAGVPAELEGLRGAKQRTLVELEAGNRERASLNERQSRATRMADMFAERAKKQSKAVKDKKAAALAQEQTLKEARRQLADAEKKLKQRRAAETAASAARRADAEPEMASQVEGREVAARRAAEALALSEERKRALAEADARLRELEDARGAAGASASAAAAEQERLATSAEQMRRAKGDALAPYATRLLRERVDQLQASGRSPFKSPPIGPIGAHVTLDKPRWHTAVLAVLEAALDGWIVGHAEDAQALQRLAREVFEAHPQSAMPPGVARPPPRVQQVLVCDYGAAAYDIRPEHKPSGGFGCVLDALLVSHPTHAAVVRNALVDALGVERVALAESAEAADGALQRGAAGPACTAFVDVRGRTVRRYGPTVISARAFASGPAASQRLRGTNAASTLAALEASRDEAAARAKEAERQLADLSRQLAAAKAERPTAVEALREATRVARKCNAAVVNREREIKLTQQVLDATAVRDDDDGDDDDDEDGGGADDPAGARELKVLKRSRDSCLADVERDEAGLAQARAQLEGAEALMEAEEAKHRSEGGLSVEELEALDAKIGATTARIRELHVTKAKIEGRIAHVEREASTLRPVAEAAERELLAPLLAAARLVCPDERGAADLVRAKEVCYESQRRRIDADPSKRVQRLSPEDKLRRAADDTDAAFCAEWICEHLDALDDRLREAEQEAGGSREELEHDVAMRRAENRRQATVVRSLGETNAAVQAQVARRTRAYESLFDSVEATVRVKFELFMARRHHNGTIKIRRDVPALDILVVPNGARQQGGAGGARAQVARDLRQLSGGERSFTTVAFMLALGEWTESPFRAADELDVFMDAVNRRVAVEAVLEFAAERDHLQMVLLTPQDLQAVEDAKASLARRRAKRARQARRDEEEAAGGGGGAGAAGDDDDEVDAADEAAAALPDGFVRVLKMPAAREQGGVRLQQQQQKQARQQQAAGDGDDE